MTDSPGLASGSTTKHAYRHVIGVIQVEQAQRGIHRGHNSFTRPKIGLSSFAIDGYRSISIRVQTHTGYSRLAPSHTIVILTFDGIGQRRFSSSLLSLGSLAGLLQQCLRTCPGNGLLSLVRMRWASVNLQVRHNVAAQAIMHDHAAYRVYQSSLRVLAFQRLAQGCLLQTTRVLAM